MVREKCGLLVVPRTVPVSRVVKEHSAEVWLIPPGTLCIYVYIYTYTRHFYASKEMPSLQTLPI